MANQDPRFFASEDTAHPTSAYIPRRGERSPLSVAALYIDPRGPYPELLGSEWCWDEERDARNYTGPHPVVAHPPCRHWGRLRHLAHVACGRCGWSGPSGPFRVHSDPVGTLLCHRIEVSDRDCAPRAIAQVHAYGGVLEHPAGSLLWDAVGLPKPGELWSDYTGYTIEVDQCEWGHVARKPTWLYLVGVPRSALEAPPFPGRQPTHWCSGNRNCKTGGSVPPGIKICSAQQRRRTPKLFAEYLIRLARAAAAARQEVA